MENAASRMDLLAQLLRAAMSDPTLLEDAFLELERVKAEEIRLAGNVRGRGWLFLR